MIPQKTETKNGGKPAKIETAEETGIIPVSTRHNVASTLAGFEARSAHYPEQTKSAAAWIFQFMHERCNGSPAVVSSILKKIDRTLYPDKEQYIYQVTSGRYFRQAGGKQAVENLLEICERLKQWDYLDQQRGRVPFNEELSNWIAMRDYIDRKRARGAVCRFGAIEGDTGMGKSACAGHYQIKNNHGMTVRFEAPSRPSFAWFVSKFAACYNIPRSLTTTEKLIELENNVNDTRTVIIENVQKLYNPRTGANQPIFSFLQELQDERGNTFIFTWTPVFREEVLRGKDSKYFEQFISRIGGIDDVLTLKRPSKADLRSIINQWEIANRVDALSILASWAKEPGAFRIIYERLQKASLLAGKHGLAANHLELVATTPLSMDYEEDES